MSKSPTLEGGEFFIEKLNFLVFPVHGSLGGVCTCGSHTCAAPAKHPATPMGFKNATRNIGALQSMFGYDTERDYTRRGNLRSEEPHV